MRSLKLEIRRSILERLKKQSPKTRVRKSRDIEERLFKRKAFRKAKVIMFYASLPEEVNTHRMIERALRLGKRVVLPRLDGKRLQPIEIHDMRKDVAAGRFGILEPRKTLRTITPRDIDLVIAPGIAFDSRGNRLGRGGGYYDRFLKRLTGQTVIGLAFKLQTVSTLPTSSRDIPVTALISA